MLEIKNLHVKIADTDTEIIKGLNLTVKKGECAAIMGPNGAGKSTLSNVISGHSDYEITSGDILFNNQSVIDLEPFERALLGIFLAFQYPMEVPGLATMEFLKVAINSHRKYAELEPLNTVDLIKKVREASKCLNIDFEMLKRPLNVGFSGGEKKRFEMLQMMLLNPAFCLLDEADSGLDIDALRIVAECVNKMRNSERAFLIITHYQRLLDYVVPDVVHIMHDGKIIKTGDLSLAKYLESHGYSDIINQNIS